jgi:hypothetical protein
MLVSRERAVAGSPGGDDRRLTRVTRDRTSILPCRTHVRPRYRSWPDTHRIRVWCDAAARLEAVAAGVIRTDPARPMADRLLELDRPRGSHRTSTNRMSWRSSASSPTATGRPRSPSAGRPVWCWSLRPVPGCLCTNTAPMQVKLAVAGDGAAVEDGGRAMVGAPTGIDGARTGGRGGRPRHRHVSSSDRATAGEVSTVIGRLRRSGGGHRGRAGGARCRRCRIRVQRESEDRLRPRSGRQRRRSVFTHLHAARTRSSCTDSPRWKNATSFGSCSRAQGVGPRVALAILGVFSPTPCGGRSRARTRTRSPRFPESASEPPSASCSISSRVWPTSRPTWSSRRVVRRQALEKVGYSPPRSGRRWRDVTRPIQWPNRSAPRCRCRVDERRRSARGDRGRHRRDDRADTAATNAG